MNTVPAPDPEAPKPPVSVTVVASVCAAQSSDPRLEGDWLGRLGDSEINAGVLCSFTSNGEHALSGTMLTGFAGATFKLDDVKVEAGKVSFAVKEYGGTFQGSFVAGGVLLPGMGVNVLFVLLVSGDLVMAVRVARRIHDAGVVAAVGQHEGYVGVGQHLNLVN